MSNAACLGAREVRLVRDTDTRLSAGSARSWAYRRRLTGRRWNTASCLTAAPLTHSLRLLREEGGLCADCCAPKLLQAAAIAGLTPISLAEFWCALCTAPTVALSHRAWTLMAGEGYAQVGWTAAPRGSEARERCVLPRVQGKVSTHCWLLAVPARVAILVTS